MEKLADNLYSDYAHHPVEIRAALEAATELGQPVVVVYQPHQNVRQHQVQNYYLDVFDNVEKVYWLPTFLSREQYNLPILKPEDLIVKLSDPQVAEVADMNDSLKLHIDNHRRDGKLVILLNAGSLDAWARENLVN
jgi:UDP-N-acetylmuramate--alanine ligase